MTELPLGEEFVAMTVHCDTIYVATKTRVYRLVNGKLEPIEIVLKDAGKTGGTIKREPGKRSARVQHQCACYQLLD